MSAPLTAPSSDPFAIPGKLVPPGVAPIVRLQGIEKYFGANHVLRGCNLDVYPSETICLIGRSGSGKSTLLRCANFLEEPTVGSVEVDGLRVEADPLHTRNRRHREQIRQIRMRAQMVFQEFNLFPHMRVIDNLIEAPIRVRKIPREQAIATAEKYLDKVGLREKRDEFPARLSGGQKQRVAIARALIGKPRLILADEPTGALDTETSQQIMDLLTEINGEGITILMVTHEHDVAARAHRTIKLRDGKVVGEEHESRLHAVEASGT